MSVDPTLDLAGIGAGPSNLSLAALLYNTPQIRACFYDQKPAFSWHPGLMMDHAYLQTSWMKDLVTPVDPTNPFSFINYLVSRGGFYAFINAEQPAVTRLEFAAYLRWVAEQLDNLAFGCRVREITFENNRFLLQFEQGEIRAQHLCLGVGVSPYVPQCARPWLGPACFHAHRMTFRAPDLSGRRVAVIGGGQTGAEVTLNALSERWGRPDKLYWVSRRDNMEPLDETAFTNEWFCPDYVSAYFQLPRARRKAVVARQKLAGDGISPSTLTQIYQLLYRRRFIDHDDQGVVLLPGRELTGGSQTSNESFQLHLQNHLHHQTEVLKADVVILCTGFETPIPKCLDGLLDRLDLVDGELNLKRDYQVPWDGPSGNRIYAVNAGRTSHGIADPQTSLMAWRSATIINSLCGFDRYNLGRQHGFIQWRILPDNSVGAKDSDAVIHFQNAEPMPQGV